MGPFTWCPYIVGDGVGRRGGRLKELEGVKIKVSDGGLQGSAHSDRLGVVVVGVSVSLCDAVSVSDGGIAGSAQSSVLSGVGVGVSDGGIVGGIQGVSFGVSGVVVEVFGVAVSLSSWARCSSAIADLKKALSPGWLAWELGPVVCCGD